MTVIAFRAGTLAADTQSSRGSGIAGHVDKIGRTDDGFLWAFTGTADFQEQCVAWAKHGRDLPAPDIAEPNENSTFILIGPNGSPREWNGRGWYETKPQEFYAWGSGAEYALGAMAMGADAAHACLIATQFDVYCGGEITSVMLGPADIALPETCGPEDDEGEYLITNVKELLERAPAEVTGDEPPVRSTWKERYGL